MELKILFSKTGIASLVHQDRYVQHTIIEKTKEQAASGERLPGVNGFDKVKIPLVVTYVVVYKFLSPRKIMIVAVLRNDISHEKDLWHLLYAEDVAIESGLLVPAERRR